MADKQIRHFDASTWLAHRALDAAQIGPPKPPSHVALPGAKQAIEHDRLLAHQELGHGQEEIVERVNARFEDQNAERLEGHRAWVGSYHFAIEDMRRAEIKRQAEEFRRKALFEQLIAERDVVNEDG